MKVYVVTEDGVDGVFAVCLRLQDAEKLVEENGWLEIHEEQVNTGGEPVFLLRGQDKYATAGIAGYRLALESWGKFQQIKEVVKALDEMTDWQHANPSRIKDPDHPHEPALPALPAESTKED